MRQDCQLCSSLGINTLNPSSRIRRCVDKKCGGKVFYATPRELYKYYTKFLELVLTDEYYRNILYHVTFFSDSSEFKKAWRIFTTDIISGKNRESIDILVRYYQFRKKGSSDYMLIKMQWVVPNIFQCWGVNALSLDYKTRNELSKISWFVYCNNDLAASKENLQTNNSWATSIISYEDIISSVTWNIGDRLSICIKLYSSSNQESYCSNIDANFL